jgi:hypothetical protein
MVLESLSDTGHPIVAALATDVIWYDLEWRLWREDTQSTAKFLVSRRPKYGTDVFWTALSTAEGRDVRSGFLYDIVKICANANISEFSYRKTKTPQEDWKKELDLPEEFTIRFQREKGSERSVVRLNWYTTTGFESSSDPRNGRVVLDAIGKRHLYTTGEHGKVTPDYKRLSKLLENAKKGSESSPVLEEFRVVLQVDAFVPARYVTSVLNACANAGITEVSITEP